MLGFICARCKRGADLWNTPQEIMSMPKLKAWVRRMHRACPGETQCDCQHRGWE